MEKDKKEIRLLKAETQILKSNVKALEKENEALKKEKSKLIFNNYEIEDKIRKQLELKFKEEKISQNQSKMFKFNNLERNYEIHPGFVLDQSLNSKMIGSEDFLQNLKFFRDYFFDDFFSISDEKAFEIMDYYKKDEIYTFMLTFELFSCKKVIFSHFSKDIFDNNSFLDLKVEILENVPPQWIFDSFESLKKFLNQNKSKILKVICNIAEKDPSNLSKVLCKDLFSNILENLKFNDNFVIGKRILNAIVSQKIQGYTNRTTLHQIPQEMLKLYYVNDYDDLIVNINDNEFD